MHARQDPGLRVVLRRTVRAGYPDQVRQGMSEQEIIGAIVIIDFFLAFIAIWIAGKIGLLKKE